MFTIFLEVIVLATFFYTVFRIVKEFDERNQNFKINQKEVQ